MINKALYYNQFINNKKSIFESRTSFVYRNTDEDWLLNFLENGYIKDTFISFSLDEDSGTSDDFGSIKIKFNLNELEKQDLIEIFYEEEFFQMYPQICYYVTGYESKQDYYENMGYDSEEEALDSNDPDAILWESYLEDFEEEQELVVSKKLELTKGLINEVIFREEPDDKLLKLLEKNDIFYEIE